MWKVKSVLEAALTGFLCGVLAVIAFTVIIYAFGGQIVYSR